MEELWATLDASVNSERSDRNSLRVEGPEDRTDGRSDNNGPPWSGLDSQDSSFTLNDNHMVRKKTRWYMTSHLTSETSNRPGVGSGQVGPGDLPDPFTDPGGPGRERRDPGTDDTSPFPHPPSSRVPLSCPRRPRRQQTFRGPSGSENQIDPRGQD